MTKERQNFLAGLFVHAKYRETRQLFEWKDLADPFKREL